METQNLWPDFIIEKIRNPKSILKEQAGFLMKKTNNLLSLEVATHANVDKIYHSFIIVAPALNNYRFHLLNVTHAAEYYYPALIDIFDRNLIEAKDETHFIESIKQVFNDPKTIRVIENLLAQSLEDDYISDLL